MVCDVMTETTGRPAPNIGKLKTSTILPSFLAPVLGGAILYYSLKDTAASDVARFANRMSFVGFGLWMVVWIAIMQLDASYTVQNVFRWGGSGVMVVGIVLAAITSGRIKTAVKSG